MRFVLVLLVLAMLVPGCARHEPQSVAPAPIEPGRPAPSPIPGKVHPGEGIEEARLGETRQDVEKRLGQPAERSANPFQAENTFGLYYREGIEISYLDDKVSMIVLHAGGDEWSAYRGSTADGLWVGSSPEEIRDRLGEPPEKLERGLKYPKQGLWFRLGENGVVESLSLISAQ